MEQQTQKLKEISSLTSVITQIKVLKKEILLVGGLVFVIKNMTIAVIPVDTPMVK